MSAKVEGQVDMRQPVEGRKLGAGKERPTPVARKFLGFIEEEFGEMGYGPDRLPGTVDG